MSNNRRRKPLASEREATFAIKLIISIVIALGGVIFLLTRTAYRSYNEKDASSRDILAPRRIKSSFTAFFEQLPEHTQMGLKHASIAGIFVLIFGVWSFDSSVNWIVHLIFVISLIVMVFYLGFAANEYRAHYIDPKYKPPVLDDPTHYETLFRNGEAPLYDEKYKNTSYTIRIPRGMEWNDERSVRFIEQLTYSFQPLLFRIMADERSIVWQVVDPLGRNPKHIESAIHVIYPEARIEIAPTSDTDPITCELHRLTMVYRANSSFVNPFRYAEDVTDFDPLTSLISALNDLQRNERASITLFVAGVNTGAYAEGHNLVTVSTIRTSDYMSAKGLKTIAELRAAGLDRTERFVPRDQKVMTEKLRTVLYQAVFLVQIDSPHEERLFTLGENIDSQMLGFAHLPYNGLVWYTGTETPSGERIPPDLEDLVVTLKVGSDPLKGSALERIWQFAESNEYRSARWATRLILSSQEMALFWHLPHEDFRASRIKWLSSRIVAPSPDTLRHNHEHFSIGNGIIGGKAHKVYMPLKDREDHVRVIGKTGSGKSTLLEHMIYADTTISYVLGNKHGVAVLDPHGTLIEHVLRYCIPPDRINDVVVLDLSDPYNPPPLNPLRGGLDYVQVGQMIQAIEHMYPETRRYPRTSYYLRHALQLLNADSEATVRDIGRIFFDEGYRAMLLERTDDPDILQAWEEFSVLKEGEKRSILDPIRTRISPFFANPELAPILCHPDSVDFHTLIREKKIILISLKMDERRVPETERNLVGALLLSRLQSAGMTDPHATPFYVYIDEVQRFTTSSLDTMFSEARKFGLSLTVAHQFLEQLPDSAQSSLIANTGATFLFASSPDDAKKFAAHIGPEFDTSDVVNLDQFTAIAHMSVHGKTQPPFTLLTPLPKGITPEDVKRVPQFAERIDLVAGEKPSAYTKSIEINGKVFSYDNDPEGYAHLIRAHSHDVYTPKRRREVTAWLKARYGRQIKLDNQGLHFEPDATETE